MNKQEAIKFIEKFNIELYCKKVNTIKIKGVFNKEPIFIYFNLKTRNLEIDTPLGRKEGEQGYISISTIEKINFIFKNFPELLIFEL